jgi:hypothetical protein
MPYNSSLHAIWRPADKITVHIIKIAILSDFGPLPVDMLFLYGMYM